MEARDGHSDNPLIVIASNRGPFRFRFVGEKQFQVKRGAGGLVTALSALAARHDVLWVACAMSPGDHAWALANNDRAQSVDDISLRLVRPQAERYDQYYNVISNPLLWFLQHQLWDIPRAPMVTEETWRAWREGYVTINRQFAQAIADAVRDSERPVLVFPQDYHLYLVPHFLREALGDQVIIQPFLHIPWPSPDAWRVLPEKMRTSLLTSLLASDRIGFQTRKDAFYFVQTCRFYLADAHSYGHRDRITYQGREVEAHSYPISIDIDRMETLAQEPETRQFRGQVARSLGESKLILRVDRIEPSKNILRGLVAYRTLLESYPEHRGKVQMLSLLVPSRMEVGEYRDYLRDIMAESGMINAQFSDGDWEPSRIVVGDNYPRAIAAMQLYDVLLVNPITDGMNLVAKEGALVNEQDGVLILSESAGAFYELGDQALVISPFDIYSTVEAMHLALTMPAEERQQRAEQLQSLVRESDIRQWFKNQVDDALLSFNNHASRASTPETPDTVTSAESSTG